MTYKKKHFTKLISCLLVIAAFLIAIPTASATTEVTPTAMDPNITSAPFGNGTYYISSSVIGNFMQVDNDVAVGTDGATFEMWNFTQADVQKWEFTHLGNSCFKIKNVASGKFLSVDPNNVNKNGASLVQKEYENDPTMHWYVYKNPSDVNYKITPMINDYVMAISVGVGADGRNVQQRNVSNQYQWMIYNINEYRYLNLPTIAYYDPNCPFTASELAEAYKNATRAFLPFFNIAFQDPSFEMCEDLSCSVTCYSYNDPKEKCTPECGSVTSCSTLHHKSAYKILNMTETSGKYFCRFTNYHFCEYDAPNHTSALGVAYKNSKKSAVSTCCGITKLEETIRHELSHNLGVPDGQCNGLCIIAGNGDKWCSHCASIIRQNY